MAGAAQTRSEDQGDSAYQRSNSPGDTPWGQAEKLHQGPHQYEFQSSAHPLPQLSPGPSSHSSLNGAPTKNRPGSPGSSQERKVVGRGNWRKATSLPRRST